ncbi:MAG: hypothetical protein KC549_18805, partial [Myxococcales bacterium]|nr:hypothetical protein [Myxococcales bacterium]
MAPACSDVDPQPGQEGGACRVSLEPCDPGLLCFGGGCHEPPGGDSTTIGVQWSFPLMGKDAVEADGVDSMVVQATLFDLATGEPMPQNFGFRMWAEPTGIGTLEILRDFNPLDAEGRWSLLDDQGRAFARFTSCDKAAADCFRYATIRIAVEPRLLAPIDQITVENKGARLPGAGGGGAGGEGGGGGP